VRAGHIAGVIAALGLAAALCGEAASQTPAETPAPAAPGPPEPPQVAAGRYLARVGDCEGCHDRPGGQRLAGGLPLNTPFGVIYAANITPDADTGLGTWSADDFWRAMHKGVRRGGAKLYPAFPYPYFTHASRAESDALYAYLRTVPAVSYRPPANRLPFPFNIRALVSVWNWMNFKEDDHPGQGASAGAHMVEGLGHCGACHTPKNFLGGDRKSQALQGGRLDNWFAPALNADPRRGLGGWSVADVVEYLQTGRNGHANASASMGDVVEHSTQHMTQTDLQAMAAYLKAQPAGPAIPQAAADPKMMAAGEAIYVDACAACHRVDGGGEPRVFPALKGAAVTQSSDPTTALRFILSGTQTAATGARPTAFSMPAYGWKLDDRQVAAVATYIRNAWGNVAPPVRAAQVAKLRKHVADPQVRKPSSPV
jgi:mono/diheme cytochrome c family protein